MSNKLISIRKRADFLRNQREGVAIRTPFFIMRTMPWKPDEIGIGFVVTKKGIDKRAVIRNRVKRRLREIVRPILMEKGHLGTAYVFYARLSARDAPFSDMQKSFLNLGQ